MRLAQHPISQFNNMLVVSVFLHGLFLTLGLFLPRMDITPRRIQSAFRVQLVEVSTGQLRPIPAPAVPSSAPQAPKLTESKPMPPPKAAPVSQPIPQPQKALAKELDQIAALAPKPRPRPAPTPKDQLLEQRVRELEALKERTPTRPVKPVVPLMQETPIDRQRAQPRVKTEKHREFDHLVAEPAQVKPPVAQKKQDDLLQDLENISPLKTTQPLVSIPTQPVLSPKMKALQSGTAEEVQRLKEQREQLASLKSDGLKVALETSKASPTAPAFKSGIHSLSAPDPTKSYVRASVPSVQHGNQSGSVISQKAGNPGADMLSQYIGEVERRVLSNWKSPFGAEHQEVQASFYLYPHGKIDRAVLIKESGNGMLDNLALRAINDSEPFPPFPKELKEPNLHITIHFHYVYQN